MDASHFYAGRFGVALLHETALRTADDYRLTRSQSAPNYQSGFDAGVYVWHDLAQNAERAGGTAGNAPEDEPFDGQETIQDEATRNVLKELGYWK